MVEMDEVVNIVNNVIKYSFIVLDEVGRGMSIYDGVSIVWVLVEYFLNDVKVCILFVIYYYELFKFLEKIFFKVKNYNVFVEEDVEEGFVIFFRKIVEGGMDRSYGIYVVKMVGLLEKVIKRVNEILESFEQEQMFSKEIELRESSILDVKGKKVEERNGVY